MKQSSPSRRARTSLRAAAVLPAAMVAWLTLGAGAAIAAPSTHAAATATATVNSHPTDAGGAANGKATGHDKGSSTNGQAQSSADHSKGNAGTSGDASKPQPVSNADQNSGGANGQCAGATYCSTRDGSPSGNGNGGGKATGKPCAGCVGKADNKNPPGQEKTDPYNTFPNNGYECDRNHGIGRSNPAHTGCTGTTTTSCPSGEVMGDNGVCTTPGGSCPEGEVMGDNGVCTTPGGSCPDGQVMDTTTGLCTTPSEDCQPTAENGFCSEVQGEHQSRQPQQPSAVLGEKVTRTPTGTLPFTGAEGIGFMIGTGGLTLALGAALMAGGRRRRGATG